MTIGGDGFLFGLAFGAGEAVREIAGFGDAAAREGERLRWMHLDWRGEDACRWLHEQAGMDPVAAEAALDETVRPRAAHFGDELLLVLRAANLEEGEERADLVSLRLLALPHCLVTLRRTRVLSAQDVRQVALAKPSAFKDPLDLVLALIGKKQEKLLREEAARAARLLDDVEASRERALVLMEELAVQSTEQLNQRIYLFTVIAGIFLPLTFLAGALGMNVGGIPFSDHPRGFAAVIGLLGLFGVGIWLLLRRKRWV